MVLISSCLLRVMGKAEEEVDWKKVREKGETDRTIKNEKLKKKDGLASRVVSVYVLLELGY